MESQHQHHQPQQQQQQQQPRWSSFTIESRHHKSTMVQTRLPDLSPCGFATPSCDKIKRKASKRTLNTSRRCSSVSYDGTASRRGHSDMALVSSSRTSGLSYLSRPSGTKRLRRSISWDVRPPTVHVLKRCTVQSTTLNDKDDSKRMETLDGGGKNETWYSVRTNYGTSCLLALCWTVAHSILDVWLV
jgi:hypothetical protein